MIRTKAVRAESERRAEVDSYMMEEDKRVSEDSIWVNAKRQARAEATRVEREMQVEAEQQAAEEEATRMEAERRADTMNPPLNFSLRFYPIKFTLSSVSDSVRLNFPSGSVLDLLFIFQIDFRLLSDSFQTSSLKKL